MRNYKVLLFDDDYVLPKLICGRFPNYQVKRVDSLPELYREYRAEEYDVLILDFDVPPLTAKDALDAILPIKNDKPIILFSGMSKEQVEINLGSYTSMISEILDKNEMLNVNDDFGKKIGSVFKGGENVELHETARFEAN